uniref:Homing endonuclease LAGLIDADG domain-containing protein n=1 Tax=Orbilia brochopaga TaxID=3140254 RepID=A0A4Y5N039_9PEZI|nr:hypothetical protein [Drechslerella brochopaga]
MNIQSAGNEQVNTFTLVVSSETTRQLPRVKDSQFLNLFAKRRFYVTCCAKRNKLDSTLINPWYFTGFTDAEGCFLISIRKNNNLKIGWNVALRFKISLHVKDKTLLEHIKNYLGVGRLYKHGPQSIEFCVLNPKDLSIVISHFDNYPLHSKKRADYELFKQALFLILNKEHLTEQGLRKILGIKASLNLGLPESLQTAFPEIAPIERPSFCFKEEIKDPYWLAGFTEGDGSFGVKISKSSSVKTGRSVYLQFDLVQHNRDELLLKNILDYFNCGSVYKHSSDNARVFKVTKFSDITEKIIQFFHKYPLLGEKSKDFKDFCQVAELMKTKAHLSEQGLNQIIKIKGGYDYKKKI